MSRGGLIAVLAVVAVGGLFGWKKYQQYQKHQAFERAHERALQGERVLIVPSQLRMDSPEQLIAHTECKGMGLDLLKESQWCTGEGEFFGIPGYVDIERLKDGRLHSVSYSFQLPARKRLTESISAVFGRAHELDGRSPGRGICWPLSGMEDIEMEWSDPNDSDPSVTVFLNSQVAAQLTQWMEARPHRCVEEPLVPGG